MRIKSISGYYTVEFCSSFDFIHKCLALPYYVFVVDRKVYNLYPELFSKIKKKDIFLLDATENNKTIEGAKRIYNFLLTKSVKRKMTLISVGGGLTQDVTGFVSSTIYRGISWIFIPTTLLAQADSCIGSKTTLNYLRYKNMLGTFYSPKHIYINTNFLKTLPKEEIFSGLGEIIKLHLNGTDKRDKVDVKRLINLISKAKLFPKNKAVLESLIVSSLNIKKRYIERDEFDLGTRNLLNYGHELGHALESVSDFAVPHGIAVIIGMIFSNTIALKRKLICRETYDMLNQLLLLPNIATSGVQFHEQYFNSARLLSAFKKDKKRQSNSLTSIVLLDSYRLIKLDNIQQHEFYSAASEVKKSLSYLIN